MKKEIKKWLISILNSWMLRLFDYNDKNDVFLFAAIAKYTDSELKNETVVEFNWNNKISHYGNN